MDESILRNLSPDVEIVDDGSGRRPKATAGKYRAVKTAAYIGEQTFLCDSKWEAERLVQLSLLQDAGEISDLRYKPDGLVLMPTIRRPHSATIRRTTYYPDYSYTENGFHVVEDAKGVRTPTYKLKRAMLLFYWPGILFRESQANGIIIDWMPEGFQQEAEDEQHE